MKPPKMIYLIPDYEYGYVWCEDPAPRIGMDEKDSIKYVKVDEILITLKHGRIFITSREKMHSTGVQLYDELISMLESN